MEQTYEYDSEKFEFDYEKLHWMILVKFGSHAEFAKAFGISRTALTNKMNNHSGWSQEDIIKAQKLLGFKDSAIRTLFFTRKD